MKDIDAFVGMYMENLIPGTLTGPLMQCIIAEQFLRWQAGDIFFYVFDNSKKPLTEGKFYFYLLLLLI